MGEIGNIWVRIGADVDDFTKGTSAAEKAIVKIGDRFAKFGRDISIAGAAITASMGAAIITTANYGDALNDLSKRTGVSVTTLSGLKLAADKSGSSLEGLATGLRGLANAMQNASSGNKEMVAKFKALDVVVTNSDGTLRSMNDVMFDVADRFASMEDGATKTALAQDLFGKSGMALIPMLNLGAAGLKAEWEQAEKLGLVMSQEAATACDEFNDSLTDLKGGLQGIGIQLGQALMPAVKSAVDGFTNFLSMVKDLAKAHPELVKTLGSGALAFGLVASTIGPLLMVLPKLIQGFLLLKGMLATTALGVGAFAATLTASVGVLVYYISKLSELSAAESKLQTATQTLRESENQLIDKLSEAAVAAGWQYGQMSDLIRAYDGNIAALTMAIKKGEEGVDIQNALAEVGKKHAEAIDEQKKKMAELDPISRKLQEALASLKDKVEELKETWVPVGRRASFVRDVLQGFAGELTSTFTPAVRDMRLVMAMAPGVFEEVGSAASQLEYVFKAIGDAMGVSAATVKVEMFNMAADVLAAYGIMIGKMPDFSAAAKTVTAETKNYFDGLFNDIATGFGNTIQQWLTGATTFRDFMEGLWGNIKDSFFRMVGEMVAEWTIRFVKNIIDSTLEIGTSIAKNVGGAVSNIAGAAGKAASGFLSALGSVGSIISGITSVIDLLKGPQKQTDVTYWLKLQWELLQNSYNFLIGSLTWTLNSIRDDLALAMKPALWVIAGAVDNAIKPALWSINEKAKTANSYLKTIAERIKNLVPAASGFSGMVTTPTLFMAGERGAEHVQVTPNKPGNTQLAGNLSFYISTIDADNFESVIRKRIAPGLRNFYRHNGNYIPAGAVGGA